MLFFENDYISLSKTFDCGQCFRWRETSDGVFSGVVAGQVVTVYTRTGGFEMSESAEAESCRDFWRRYFDLDMDYASVVTGLSADAYFERACQSGHGIVLLNQEPFETLISFIISQNNNIKRIRGIIERLCEMYGEKLDGGYAFPTAEKLASLSLSQLDVLRAGFRAKYIMDAARKIADGEVDLQSVPSLSYDDAKEELCRIKGVGDKVADCVLLFAFGKRESFPKDVWIKRALAENFPDGLPDCVRGHEGIAQQMMFYYSRYNNSLTAD